MKESFLNAMKFRHACKVFDEDKKIPDEDFEYILETGRLSPSSFGFEPWQFLVVQNKNLREKLKEFTWGGKSQLPTCSHFVIILSRKRNSMIYDSEYISYMMKDIQNLPENIIELKGGFYEKFQKSDFDLFNNDRAIFDWATKQTYIALGNMMTAAAYIGVDSCPIEGFDMEKMRIFLEEDLNINSQEFGVSCMLAFGYRKENPREKTRQNINNISKWYN
ncbi:nitroreductase [Malaciobacter marinus]|uniref:NAD(P)H-dependent oxidoreductase n=1 Tax=Malaciobacter marinus TaxID=505249 RepID=A0A347TKB9_9BACT|nr:MULTISPECIES: NAD(P)H-dependent oxidoreductase [Malaciobacter]AXX87047.1 nitroreductase [Malaciobacter marinus]PHO11400.1 NAD(P)H-dependent oxidoreductase [Malaciobacter marinus]PHO14603.1 NAD(P)H-dependent oxidoreductase [Malaciobacter marinus]RYA22369.1 NAD(P)H-dependent oxidoreductase [Malaciobacter halophilus]